MPFRGRLELGESLGDVLSQPEDVSRESVGQLHGSSDGGCLEDNSAISRNYLHASGLTDARPLAWRKLREIAELSSGHPPSDDPWSCPTLSLDTSSDCDKTSPKDSPNSNRPRRGIIPHHPISIDTPSVSVFSIKILWPPFTPPLFPTYSSQKSRKTEQNKRHNKPRLSLFKIDGQNNTTTQR